MILYPAIDIMNGRAVRLRQGKRDQVTDYGSPVEMASIWKNKGAKWLHVVDLDAAFDGSSKSMALLHEVVDVFDGRVEIGGGIRNMDDLDIRMQNLGVSRAVIGTAAAEDPDFVAKACRKYPGKIAVGIDSRDGMATTRGWVQSAGIRAVDLALQMKDVGVTTIIYTDISRDGMMMGPNIINIRNMVQETGLDVIASGGISSLNDIHEMADIGCAGVIMGRSLYEHRFRLEDAIDLVNLL